MKRFDLKSSVIGLLLGICLMLVLGAANRGDGDVGRYEVERSGQSGACFVIDSVTGQTWVRYSGAHGLYMGSPQEWSQEKPK
jgi:hypothetical protein